MDCEEFYWFDAKKLLLMLLPVLGSKCKFFIEKMLLILYEYQHNDDNFLLF